ESDRAQVAGFVMRRCCPKPSNFRSEESLSAFLDRSGVVGIEEVDTRAITRRLRVDGAMPAVISSEDHSDETLVKMAKEAPSMAGQDLASDAGSQEIYQWTEAVSASAFGREPDWDVPAGEPHVVAIDFGVKRNILRLLRSCGFKVTVVPARTSAEDILALNPDGIFASNGPGDPAAVVGAAATMKTLIDTGKPVFGICLGHQIIALALGAKSFKLKFGHRGVNHPIQRLSTGAVEIASHNHGFAVDLDSLPDTVELTHLNLNDKTCAGIAHKHLPVFSVQYHPEACPGPSDPLYLFRLFSENIAQTV
nr:glutamine-hydrolyzing carbamoyl-phosphate synthase small subunit [Planctomycetota bacterium]